MLPVRVPESQPQVEFAQLGGTRVIPNVSESGFPGASSTLCALCKSRAAVSFQTTCAQCARDSLARMALHPFNSALVPPEAAHLSTMADMLAAHHKLMLATVQPSFQDSVRKLLVPGEVVHFSLALKHLRCAPKTLAEGEVFEKGQGVLVLTDLRLMLLCWEFAPMSGAMSVPRGDATLVQLSYCTQDALWFSSIPRAQLLHLTLQCNSEVLGNGDVRQDPLNVEFSCCENLYRACFGQPSCCGGPDIGYSIWNPVGTRAARSNVQVLKMGIMLPPWNQPHVLYVTVHPDVPRETLLTFAAVFHTPLQQPQTHAK